MRTLLFAALLSMGTLLALSQSPAIPPAGGQKAAKPFAFDVISIRPNNGGAVRQSMGMTHDGFEATNVELHSFLMQAFELQQDDQLLGGPKWMGRDRWDIHARIAPENVPALEKMSFHDRLAMFQEILVERCALKFHHETRELPAYALVVAPGGPKITLSRSQGDREVPGDPGVLRSSRGSERGQGTMMKFLAEDLSEILGRKVIDRTNLIQRYDFTLTWTSDDGAAVGADAGSGGSSGPSLFTAVQEQLGLRLEPVKAPVDVVVIDRIERPGEN